MSHVGDLIHTARTARSASLADLASQVALSRQYLNQIERSWRRGHPAMIKQIANALDIPENDIYAAWLLDQDERARALWRTT